METPNRNHRQANPERKWIRLQETGLVLLLSVVFVIWAGFELKDGILVAFVPWLLITCGLLCLKTGYHKRVELRDQEDK